MTNNTGSDETSEVRGHRSEIKIKTAGDEVDCAKQHVRVIITGHIVIPGEAHSDGETDQKQTRSSTPGQTKKMTNVLRNVIAIAILAISGKGGVADSVALLPRRDRAALARRSSKVTASTAASQTQNNPTR